MPPSAHISEILQYGPNLSMEYLTGITGNMATHKNIHADLTFENEFDVLQNPLNKIVKMSMREHVDSFFNDGKLKLGTLRYFQTMENDEARDPEEGLAVLAARNASMTLFGRIASGFNHYVFCAFDGNPTNDIIERFGYDDAFEIVDAVGFSDVVSKALNARQSQRSKCLYKRHKALVSRLREDYVFNGISAELSSDLADKVQYFIKHARFKHQQEYRFMWEVEEDKTEPLILTCPDAVQYCKRV